MIRFAILCLLFVACAVALPTTTKHDVKDEVAGVTSTTTNAATTSNENEVENPRRTIITFDQRQEGKFNVRADLENFVIVFVPSSPSQGMSLLDMLASMKRNQGKTSNKRIPSENKETDAIKTKYPKKTEAQKVSEPSSAAARVVDHFIEGRTPYKVDISSTLTDSDTTTTVVDRNVIVVEGNKNRVPKHLGLYKKNNLKSNSVVALINPISSSSGDGLNDELYQDNKKEIVAAAPRFVTSSSSIYLKELTDSIPSIDSLKLESPDNDWKLLGATEPGCGPDRNMRRDSYGICRFYPLDI